MLDRLSEWPWITADDLGGLLELSPSGVSKLTSRLGRLGLVSRLHLGGRRRLALSRRGLALLARRDGVHHFMAALTRQAKRHSGFRVLQVSPPHHAARYFRRRGRSLLLRRCRARFDVRCFARASLSRAALPVVSEWRTGSLASSS